MISSEVAQKFDDALIIFIKNSVAGKVKTRIAHEVGPEKALDIYDQLLEYTRNVCLGINAERLLYYSDFLNDDAWDSTKFTKYVQRGSNLGERMHTAISEQLAKHQKVVLIGSDCPEITTREIERAFEVLDDHDVVLGPTSDGGYYLIGMTNPLDFIWDNIPWSTDQVFGITCKRLQHHQCKYYLLPVLSDVDYFDDWKRLGWAGSGMSS